MISKTVGHYEITSQLGKGGMGEVYRARDTKLNRDVALKVLPAEFANDPERMARFKREAQLLASLNHTNIAAIYGLEESSGVSALVMELAEGPTLADRISKGPIPLDEALAIARQIAEALEAAHEKGIIHRDLKPANIKVAPDGAVKVLDFGLAKAMEGEAAAADMSQSPTLSLAATKAGIILGTAAYMAPEQARGTAVDKRCDIWSFGVVLFEMLTGKQFFAGETVSDTLAAVLRSDVDWNVLPANTPAGIRALLRRCLAKDRKLRLRDIGEARIMIEEYLANPSSAPAQGTADAESSYRLRDRLLWIGAVVLLAAAVAVLGVLYYSKISEPPQVTQFEFTLPDDQRFVNTSGNLFLAISPDGRKLAYSTNKGLFVRSLDNLVSNQIGDVRENPSNPFFSPDSKWVAYRSSAENKLKKVPVNGGMPITVCDIGMFSGAFWGRDDVIFYGEYSKAMMRISAVGGTPEEVFRGDAPFYFHPQRLPGSESLLFTINPYPYRIAARSPGSKAAKVLIDPGDRAFYLPTGHLVYGNKNHINAVPFDPSKMALTGAATSVVEGVYRTAVDAALQFDISSSGTLIYAQAPAGDDVSNRTIVWVDRNGKEEAISNCPPSDYGGNYSAPRISPSGTQVAFAATDNGNIDIWIFDMIRKTRTRLTDAPGQDDWPLWTEDGKNIVYCSTVDGKNYIVNKKAADGAGESEKLGSLINTPALYSWYTDDKILSCEPINNIWRLNIAELSIKGGVARRSLIPGKDAAQHPQISPDGKWLAYASNETGQNQVYVRAFPDVNMGLYPVSTNGGYGPLWSKDGREIFYRNEDSVMAVAVEPGPGFRLGQPKELFKGKYFSKVWGGAVFPIWDISRKDNRFLMAKEPGSTTSATGGSRKIIVVMHWLEELKKRLPAK